MKMLTLAATATLLAAPAFAQGSGNLGAQQPYAPSTQAPVFQQGSGQRAGGPANELNSRGTAADTTTSTGTVVTQPGYGTSIEVQQGSGQRSGGPANELNTGGTVVPAR